MPYANIADKRAYEASWRRRKRREDAGWHEREKARKRAAYVPESQNPNWHEDRAHENEQRWRFHVWELAHMDGQIKELLSHLTQRTMLQITNPIFYFELNGQVQEERLNEPLPTW